MESTLSDPDLCTGDDCDNLGRESQHRLRILLIPRQLADTLGSLNSHADAARKLDELMAYRPQIDATVTSPTNSPSASCRPPGAPSRALRRPFPPSPKTSGSAHRCLWRRPHRRLGPAPRRHRRRRRPAAAQPCHDFLKDFVTTWNELREALLADTSVPLPASGAFPKHLLAGALADPQAARTPFYPAAGDAHAREAAAEARFLMRRMSLLISQYAAPPSPRFASPPATAKTAPWASGPSPGITSRPSTPAGTASSPSAVSPTTTSATAPSTTAAARAPSTPSPAASPATASSASKATSAARLPKSKPNCKS
jgi:hypothetical protein